MRLGIAILLCSASPRRRKLIKKLRLKVKVFKPKVDESGFKLDKKFSPAHLVMKLAFTKALEGAKKFPHKEMLALGADTIVVLGRDIIGKPRDENDAARILGRLSGTYHEVLTGVALINTKTLKSVIDFERSRAKMRKLSFEEIKTLSKKHMDKAGAYAVQEKGDAFIEKIEGDYYNVVGFPLKKIRTMLQAVQKIKSFKPGTVIV